MLVVSTADGIVPERRRRGKTYRPEMKDAGWGWGRVAGGSGIPAAKRGQTGRAAGQTAGCPPTVD